MPTLNQTTPHGTGSSHARWIAIEAVVGAVAVGVVLLVYGGGGGSGPGY